jgi:hypothetical protein
MFFRSLDRLGEPAPGIGFSLEHDSAKSGRLDAQELNPNAAGVGAEY